MRILSIIAIQTSLTHVHIEKRTETLPSAAEIPPAEDRSSIPCYPVIFLVVVFILHRHRQRELLLLPAALSDVLSRA